MGDGSYGIRKWFGPLGDGAWVLKISRILEKGSFWI